MSNCSFRRNHIFTINAVQIQIRYHYFDLTSYSPNEDIIRLDVGMDIPTCVNFLNLIFEFVHNIPHIFLSHLFFLFSVTLANFEELNIFKCSLRLLRKLFTLFLEIINSSLETISIKFLSALHTRNTLLFQRLLNLPLVAC